MKAFKAEGTGPTLPLSINLVPSYTCLYGKDQFIYNMQSKDTIRISKLIKNISQTITA